MASVTAAELRAIAEELGLDVIGAARAEPYARTEREIRERRERGLFADMRFTMAHPEVSCHPETWYRDMAGAGGNRRPGLERRTSPLGHRPSPRSA
ncbi:MAG: hypothetical protein ACXVYM_07145, partial [Gaiellaceae bacterium]